MFTPLAGFEVAVPGGEDFELPVREDFEYGVIAVDIGGEPFTEPLLMWWNFVARSGAEITQAREDWTAGRFSPVPGYPAPPLPAPELPPVPLRPRPFLPNELWLLIGR